MNAPCQRRQPGVREIVEPEKNKQAEHKPANGLYPTQKCVRPNHAAKGIGHQRQRERKQAMELNRGVFFACVAQVPKVNQGSSQYEKRNQYGLEGVL